MKFLFLCLLIMGSIPMMLAQKLAINTAACEHFSVLENPVISNDGNYLAYFIKSVADSKKKLELVIRSAWNSDSISIHENVKGNINITFDSRYCIFQGENDSLWIYTLGANSIRCFPNVSYYEIPDKGNAIWLKYVSRNPENETVLLNLKTNEQKKFKGIGYLSDNGKSLVVQSDNGSLQTIDWIDLDAGVKTNVWKGNKLKGYVACDLIHNQLVFESNDSIFYYKAGMQQPVCLISKQALISESEFERVSVNRFNQKGSGIYLDLIAKNTAVARPPTNDVEIWSYTDRKLQLTQEKELNNTSHLLGFIHFDDFKLIRLQKYQDEQIYKECNDMILSLHSAGNGEMNERTWNATGQLLFDVIDTRTGKRKRLDRLNGLSFQELSPSGKYVIYYDETKAAYFSYNTESEQYTMLTRALSNFRKYVGAESDMSGVRGIAGWSPNAGAVFIYDRNDIWKLDPSGETAPVNITNGYGAKHNIVFTIALNHASGIISVDEPLILTAFNTVNKENGFFSKRVEKKGDPGILSMGPFMYTNNSPNVIENNSFQPIKAKNTNTYIVRRMTPTDAPNYFSTHDFKTFKRLTDYQPQKKYNWYTAELHNWKSLDGRKLQGILYKPEDFDPNKKYPVIFYYYERLSDGLYSYLLPEISRGPLNIPSYVSNGYLVFCPDIYYKTGYPMQGTYDAVVSAADYVAALPFVNSRKMGIQGQSWGAIQTNYLITKTHLFAAACSSSSVSDWISHYGSITLNGSGTTMMIEDGQFRAGSTLWKNLQGYIKNSPVLNADKVTTPLLMKQGKLDEGTSFANALEFFLGLRRLGKKAWMLAYPTSGHVNNLKDAKDFTIRMMQFFDHYLKDKPAPLWMLDGIPAVKRGIDNGLQLDASGRTPGPGILIPEEQSKADALMTRKPVTITLD